MAAVTIQNVLPFAGLNHTYAGVATGDTLANDGHVLLLFKNANASDRTLTLAGNAVDKPGFGTISAADMGEAITLPGSGTNGGECVVGPLPPDRFNNSAGNVVLTINNATGLTVAALRIGRY